MRICLFLDIVVAEVDIADAGTAGVCCGLRAAFRLALLLLLATVVPTHAFGPPL